MLCMDTEVVLATIALFGELEEMLLANRSMLLVRTEQRAIWRLDAGNKAICSSHRIILQKYRHLFLPSIWIVMGAVAVGSNLETHASSFDEPMVLHGITSPPLLLCHRLLLGYPPDLSKQATLFSSRTQLPLSAQKQGTQKGQKSIRVGWVVCPVTSNAHATDCLLGIGCDEVQFGVLK